MQRAATGLVQAICSAAHTMTGAHTDLDPLLDMIGDARVVLLGEASHGTQEFYHLRAELTKRLILERGFHAVAAEAEWPASYRINRYIRGGDTDTTGRQALADFTHFPMWMWRNAEVLDFVEWIRWHNQRQPSPEARVSFYGLDLYSLFTSAQAVLSYLDKVDPEAAQRARYRYACFEQFHEDPQAYGYASRFGLTKTCEDAAITQLADMHRNAAMYMSRDGRGAIDEYFYAAQNARLVKNAETYYRAMFAPGVNSWNIRDQHMAETLDALLAHLDQFQSPAKVVVWAHNSHVGDARATEMGDGGELNIGQLARERYGRDTVTIGFTTTTGTVSAASGWDEPVERKRVNPAIPGSYEALFHKVGIPRFSLVLRGQPEIASLLHEPLLERAIGVIYLPKTERTSHYFYARLPEQFDAIIHVNVSSAVEPLEWGTAWSLAETPTTYPSGV